MIHQLNITLATPAYQYHWRSANSAEVDIVLERDDVLYPIEVKTSASISGHDLRGMGAFRETYSNRRIATGIVFYNGTRCYPLNQDTIAVPWRALFKP